MGFPLKNLRGLDILEHRIHEARERFPEIIFDHADATSMPYKNSSYDLVFESTMFLQITDDALASKIGKEMLRVTKIGGHIILTDWRYGKLGNPDFNAVTKKRISKIFNVGSQCKIHSQHKGALIPPIGRFLSKHISPLYFIIQSMFPFLVGQVTTVLQKTSN